MHDGQSGPADTHDRRRPALRLTSVSISTPDPRALAAFYSRVLGWSLSGSEPARPGFPPGDGWAQLRPTPGEPGPTLNLEWEREFVPPVWPSVPDEQQLQTHLDIAVDDLDAAVAWGLACGARPAATQFRDDVRVMLDPDGHPFCFFRDR